MNMTSDDSYCTCVSEWSFWLSPDGSMQYFESLQQSFYNGQCQGSIILILNQPVQTGASS